MNQIYTPDNFDFATAKVGDLVTEEVVDNCMNALPPACMRTDCCQMGEPYSHRFDPETGRFRATFSTFKRVEKGVYAFCGYCFNGENEER